MPERNPMTTLNRIYIYYEKMLARQGLNGNSCDWFELENAPDLDVLRQAAASVSRRHAALQAAGSFAGLTGWGWTRNPQAQPDTRYVRTRGRCPEQAADQLVPQNVWGEPLDHANGPPWRIFVTEYDDLTILQSVTSHIYTCGKSANLISVQLVSAYEALMRGEVPVESPAGVPDRANAKLFMPKWSAWRHLRSFAATMLDMLRETVTAPVALAGNTSSKLQRGRTRVRFEDLGPDVWQHLRQFARSEQISRHPFYLAAWVETITAFNAARGQKPKGKVKLIDNFSLRPFSDQDLDGYYDICAVPSAIEVPSGPSTRTQREQIFETVETLRAGKVLDDLTRYAFYHKVIAFLPKVLATKLVLMLVVKSPFILSNIGPVPPQILNASALQTRRYFSFPQLFPPGKIMLLITTTPDSLRAVFLWDEDAVSCAEMENEMIPAFKDALARSIGLGAAGSQPQAAE